MVIGAPNFRGCDNRFVRLEASYEADPVPIRPCASSHPTPFGGQLASATTSETATQGRASPTCVAVAAGKLAVGPQMAPALASNPSLGGH